MCQRVSIFVSFMDVIKKKGPHKLRTIFFSTELVWAWPLPATPVPSLGPIELKSLEMHAPIKAALSGG
jgi:hypothetical protein